MAVEATGSWGAAVRGVGVTFRDFFTQNADAYTPSWEPVVKTTTDDGATATFSGKTGAGILTLFEEGATIPDVNRYKLYDTAFVHKQYGGKVTVTRQQLMNRDFKDKFDEFKDLMVAARNLKSKAPAQIFNGAFSNAGTFMLNQVRVVTYADGKNLCSTVHPRVDGGAAQSNASSTGITFSDSNMETGRVALLEQLQDDGTPVAITGQVYLVGPTKLEKDMTIVTGSNLRASTANNDINIYEGGGYPVLISKWLGTTFGGLDTRWFLVAPSLSKLILIIRNDVEMDQNPDKNTLSMIFTTVLDMSVGSYDWHGVWGSMGDGLSYVS